MRFVYDPKHTDAKPSVTEYTYDEDGKLTKVTDVLKKSLLSLTTLIIGK
ncbi:RHS repeat domain-containing protein [Priestia megaterium]